MNKNTISVLKIQEKKCSLYSLSLSLSLTVFKNLENESWKISTHLYQVHSSGARVDFFLKV